MTSINRFGSLSLYTSFSRPCIHLRASEDVQHPEISLNNKHVSSPKDQFALAQLEQEMLRIAKTYDDKLCRGGTSVTDDDLAAAELIKTVRKPLIQIIQGLNICPKSKRTLLEAINQDPKPFVGLPCAETLAISIDFEALDKQKPLPTAPKK